MSSNKLPEINPRGSRSLANIYSPDKKSGSIQYDLSQNVSPFKLPTDDEVFVYRDVERKKMNEIKNLTKDMKIYEKKTGTTRRALRLFKDTGIFDTTEVKPYAHKGFTSKEKAVITEAQKIILDRKKERNVGANTQRENNLELIERKKEIFMVERTVGILENERERLVLKGSEKEDALKKSEEMLEKDWKEFESYKSENKQDTDLAIQKLNVEIEARRKTEVEFKVKNTELITIKSENSKNEELIQKFQDAKDFLEKITPKDYAENQRQQLKKKIEEVKAQWLEKEAAEKEESFTLSSENFTKSTFNSKFTAPLRKTMRPDNEKIFEEKLARCDIEEIETFKLEQKMYFTKPKQLEEILQRLEESNLAIIQSMQDTEQSLELLRNSLQQKKIDFEKKIGGLRENKNHLEKSKHEKQDKIRTLNQKIKEPKTVAKDNELGSIRKKIFEIASLFKDGSNKIVDEEVTSTLDVLTLVELQLYKQLEKLSENKPARIMELKKQLEDVRKGKNRKLQLEREQAAADERSRKASERILETTKKRKGRADMTKSTPFEKKEKVVEVVNNGDEDEDMKYFKPYLSQF